MGQHPPRNLSSLRDFEFKGHQPLVGRPQMVRPRLELLVRHVAVLFVDAVVCHSERMRGTPHRGSGHSMNEEKTQRQKMIFGLPKTPVWISVLLALLLGIFAAPACDCTLGQLLLIRLCFAVVGFAFALVFVLAGYHGFLFLRGLGDKRRLRNGDRSK